MASATNTTPGRPTAASRDCDEGRSNATRSGPWPTTTRIRGAPSRRRRRRGRTRYPARRVGSPVHGPTASSREVRSPERRPGVSGGRSWRGSPDLDPLVSRPRRLVSRPRVARALNLGSDLVALLEGHGPARDPPFAGSVREAVADAKLLREDGDRLG